LPGSLWTIISDPEILLSNGNQNKLDSYEHRVVLANIGFHENTLLGGINPNRYQTCGIAFGIAKADIDKDQMLVYTIF